MRNSWSGLRKELENDFLCESLRGRIQYFITCYHKAPDNHGRIAIRVDGKEVIMGNPYDYYVKGYADKEDKLKEDLQIPERKWSWKETFFDKENQEVENMVHEIAINDGVFDIYDITSAIHQYKNLAIEESINSYNPIIRMLAILDRRMGKRRLVNLIHQVKNQPEWLQFFYNLRLKTEGLL